MNFYKSQDEARRRTKILVIYYIIAMMGVVVSLYSILAFAKMRFMPSTTVSFDDFGNRIVTDTSSFWDLQFFAIVSIATVGVILCGWLYKKVQVSGGGGAVAQSMGGRPIDPNTRDPEEKQLVNVVEEMAIASGVPVPQVWVMDGEMGINAFAAGTEPGNAVIGVTRGTMQRLNRAELQGVVAHEFSHILNGDMLMNIRMMCMLHGLLLISIIGRQVFTIVYYTGAGRGRSKEEGNAQLPLLAIGIALMVVGSVGAFFASLIQAAISRQREYLADASAVEFTMDPDGIAGALKKIGGASHRSNVQAPSASEMQHMFFAPAGMFSYGFSSHPPLEERIQLIDKSWDGEFTDSHVRNVHEHAELQRGQMERAQPTMEDAFGPGTILAGAMIEAMGESSQHKIQKGQTIVAGLDQTWIDACHDRTGARLLIFGMLLAEDGELRDSEVEHLHRCIGEQMAEVALQWQYAVSGIHSSKKIALVDMCIPTLRRLSSDEYHDFIEMTQWLISSDNSVDLFEFMLQKILQRHLDSHFLGARKVKVRHTSITSLVDQINIVISTMSGVGASSQQDLDAAYAAAANMLTEYGCPQMTIAPPQNCGIDKIDQALAEIDQASPLVKKQFLLVCGEAVMNDGEVTSREAEILRATADAIGCAVPPFVKM